MFYSVQKLSVAASLLTMWCRGAALSKMLDSAVVTSVSAVRHYGVESGCLFDHLVDKGEKTYVDYYTGEVRAERVSQVKSCGCADFSF